MANWNLAEKQIYKLLKHPFQKEKSEIEAITAAYLESCAKYFQCQFQILTSLQLCAP